MNRLRRCVVAFGLGLFLSPVGTFAQVDSEPAEDAQLDDLDGDGRAGTGESHENQALAETLIRVELVAPDGEAVHYFVDDLLVVRITAVREQEVEIRSVRASLLGRTGRMFSVAVPCSVSGISDSHQGEVLQLKKGDYILATCRMSAVPDLLGWGFALLSSAREGRALVEVETAGRGHSSTWPSERVTFAMVPLFISPLAGGMFGALMLALLSLLLTPGQSLRDRFTVILLGPLIALILILGASLFSADDAGALLPISLSITDFQGGFLVGLLGFLLKRPVAAKLGILDGNVSIKPCEGSAVGVGSDDSIKEDERT